MCKIKASEIHNKRDSGIEKAKGKKEEFLFDNSKEVLKEVRIKSMNGIKNR